MTISQYEYDQKPLAIRHGALLLWGKLLTSDENKSALRQLYKFNDFIAQVCYDGNQQRVTCIYTCSAR